jgi:amidohydrolase
MKCKDKIESIIDSCEELYKYLHQNPELSFQEKETSNLLKQKLGILGFEIVDNLGGYGFAGILKNGDGPIILYRTDMDALPIAEKTDLPYSSNKTAILDGKETRVMHACGHDIHMATLIGTAEILLDLKKSWKGTLIVLAQPAEEKGGAQVLLKNNLFSHIPVPDIALALHVSSTLEAGKVGYCPGPAYASVGTLDITVVGQGGHGAYPHQCIDPIVLTSKIILALQTIVSREISPMDPAVITVGSIHAGTKHNIIPESVKLKLTLRTYSDEVMNQIINSIKRICKGEAISSGLKPIDFPVVDEVDERLPVLYNNLLLTESIAETLKKEMGNENIVQIQADTGAEDFSRYSKTKDNIPICMLKTGTVSADQIKDSVEKNFNIPSLHSSYFAPVPKLSLETGIEAMSLALIGLFNKQIESS